MAVWTELEFERPQFPHHCAAEVVRIDDQSHEAAVRFEAVDKDVEQRVVRWVYAEDRRIFDRRAQARARVRVVCRAQGPDAGVFAAPSLDISADGVRILTDRALRPGNPLQLELHFGDGDAPFSFRASVVRTGGSGARTAYGLRFDGLHTAERRRLVDRCVIADRRQRQ